MKKARLRLRFSFRTIGILFVILAATLTCWLKLVEEPIKRQWAAADQLAGSVINSSTPGVIKFTSIPSNVPTWMRWRFRQDKFDHIDSVLFKGQQNLPLEQMQPLRDLPHLAYVELTGMGATDEHARLLSEITTLKGVFLDDNNVTDAGAKLLLQLPQLKTIVLQRNPVTWRPKVFLSKIDVVKISFPRICEIRNVQEIELLSEFKGYLPYVREFILTNPSAEMLSAAKQHFDFNDLQKLVLRFTDDGHDLIPVSELAELVHTKKTPYRTFQLIGPIENNFREQLLALLAEECNLAIFNDTPRDGDYPEWWTDSSLNSIADMPTIRLEFPFEIDGTRMMGLDTIFISDHDQTIDGIKALPALKHIENWTFLR